MKDHSHVARQLFPSILDLFAGVRNKEPSIKNSLETFF